MSVAAVKMKDDLDWTESQKGLVLVSILVYIPTAHSFPINLSSSSYIYDHHQSLPSTGAMPLVSCLHQD